MKRIQGTIISFSYEYYVQERLEISSNKYLAFLLRKRVMN